MRLQDVALRCYTRIVSLRFCECFQLVVFVAVLAEYPPAPARSSAHPEGADEAVTFEGILSSVCIQSISAPHRRLTTTIRRMRQPIDW